MADNIVNIILRARDETRQALDAVQKQLAAIQNAIQSVNSESLIPTAQGVTTVGEAALASRGHIESLTQSLGETLRVAKDLAIAFAAIFTGGLIRNFAQTAARAEVLATVLKVVGTNAGIGTERLREMDEAVQKMGITAAASRQSLVQLIQAGLISAETSYKAAQLARAAQDLAVVSGQNSSETFQRLVVNINQMDALGLRFMGLILDREEAYRKYAEALGKTSDQLTLAERKQAFMNATLAEAQKLSGSYEASMTKAEKQVQSLARITETLREELGKGLQPAYLAVVGAITSVLESVTKATKAFNENRFAAEVLGKVISGIGAAIVALVNAAAQFPNFTVFAIFATLLLPIVGILIRIVSWIRTFGAVTTSVFAQVGSAVANTLGRWPLLASSFGAALTTLPAIAAFAVKGVLLAFAAFTLIHVVSEFKVVRDIASATMQSIVAFFKGSFLVIEEIFLRTTFVGKTIWATLTGGGQAARDEIARQFNESHNEIKDKWVALGRDIKKSISEIGKENEDPIIEETKEKIRKVEEYKRSLAKLTEERAKFERLARTDPDAKNNFDRLTNEIAELDKKKNALSKEITALEKKLSVGGQTEVEDFRHNIRVDTKDTENRIKEAKEDLQQALKQLKLSQEDVVFKGSLVIDKDFDGQLGGLRSLVELLSQPRKFVLNDELVKVGASLQQVEQAYFRLAQNANSFDAISLLISQTTAEVGALSERIVNERQNLTFRQEKKAVEEFSKAVEGLSGRYEQLRSSSETVRRVQEANADSMRVFRSVVSELGGDIRGLTAESGSVQRALSETVNRTAELSRQSVEQNNESIASSRTKFEEELNQIKSVKETQSRLVKLRYTEEKEQKAALHALSKESLQQEIKVSLDYFESLRKGRDAALSEFKKYAQEVINLTKEIRTQEENKEKNLYTLRQKGLTDQQKLNQDRQRADDLQGKARTAALKGDVEQAKKLYQELIDIRNSIADRSVDDQGRVRLQELDDVEAAHNGLIEVTRKEREEAIKARDEQRKQFAELTVALDNLAQKIKELATALTLKVKVELEDEEYKKKVKEIQDTPVKSIPLTVQTEGVKQAQENVQELTRKLALLKAELNTAKTTDTRSLLDLETGVAAPAKSKANIQDLTRQIQETETKLQSATEKASLLRKELEITTKERLTINADTSKVKDATKEVKDLKDLAAKPTTVDLNVDKGSKSVKDAAEETKKLGDEAEKTKQKVESFKLGLTAPTPKGAADFQQGPNEFGNTGIFPPDAPQKAQEVADGVRRVTDEVRAERQALVDAAAAAKAKMDANQDSLQTIDPLIRKQEELNQAARKHVLDTQGTAGKDFLRDQDTAAQRNAERIARDAQQEARLISDAKKKAAEDLAKEPPIEVKSPVTIKPEVQSIEQPKIEVKPEATVIQPKVDVKPQANIDTSTFWEDLDRLVAANGKGINVPVQIQATNTETVSREISQTMQASPVQMLFQAAPESINTLKANITDAFRGVQIPIEVIARSVGGPIQRAFGGPIRRASGGRIDEEVLKEYSPIKRAEGGTVSMFTPGASLNPYGKILGPGTGTSDSILALISSGEWILRAAAVNYYGEEFIQQLNSMVLPKFADGKMGSAPVQSVARPVADLASLDLKIQGKKAARVSGSRQDIKNLVHVLQTMERGL